MRTLETYLLLDSHGIGIVVHIETRTFRPIHLISIGLFVFHISRLEVVKMVAGTLALCFGLMVLQFNSANGIVTPTNKLVTLKTGQSLHPIILGIHSLPLFQVF